MKIKKIILASMILSLSILTLSSCQYIQQFIEDNTVKPEPAKTTEEVPATSDETPVSTGTHTLPIPTTPIIPTLPIDDTTVTTTVDLDGFNYYGYNDLGTYPNSTNYKKLYDDLYAVCDDLYNSDTDLTEFKSATDEYGETRYYYLFANVNYQNYNLDSDSTKASQIAIAIFKTMLLDHPEFYFVSNIVYYNDTTIKPTCTADYKDGAARTLYKTKIEQYKAAVKEEFTIFDNTEEKKTKKIHDYIANNASYSMVTKTVLVNNVPTEVQMPDPSTYAHNILGIIINKKGVCESYAELFQLLMNDNDIECIMVTGTGYSSSDSTGEGHAWNYAKINSNWYGFDVTWDDPIGALHIQHEYYGKVDSEFTTTHVPAVQGDFTKAYEYLYNLPTLASSNLTTFGL